MIEKFSKEYSFLSNFYYSVILFNGIAYQTVEHAFQAIKTLDVKKRMEIAALSSPGKAKKAGRCLDIRKDWENIKVEVMRSLLKLKFKNSSMKKMLLATKGNTLIEGNTWGDTFWGVCNGDGENMLGKLLMELRDSY